MSNPKTILVAEDDKFLSNAYRLKLGKAGYATVMAADGEEVIRQLAEKLPDLILLDLMMPVKDGFSVLEDIGADSRLKKVPVIVASNLGQKEDIDRAMGLGAKDYVVKSDLSLEQLLKKIKSVLG